MRSGRGAAVRSRAGSPGPGGGRSPRRRELKLPRVRWVLGKGRVHLLLRGWGGAGRPGARPARLPRGLRAESVIPAVGVSATFHARAAPAAVEGAGRGRRDAARPTRNFSQEREGNRHRLSLRGPRLRKGERGAALPAAVAGGSPLLPGRAAWGPAHAAGDRATESVTSKEALITRDSLSPEACL